MPGTGVSTESGPGIETRTATFFGLLAGQRRPARGAVLSGTRAKAIPRDGASTRARPRSRRSAGVDTLFPASPTGYVTDAPGWWTRPPRRSMTSLLARLREMTGAEIAVVTLPTIGQDDEAEVALAIGRGWGVGAKAPSRPPRAATPASCCSWCRRQNHEPGTGTHPDRGRAGARGDDHRRRRGPDPRAHPPRSGARGDALALTTR